MNHNNQDFVAEIANQLRAGLSIISSHSDNILKDIGDDSKIISTVGHLSSLTDSLEKTLNDLLDYSAINSRKITFDENMVETHDLVNSVISIMGPIAERKRIEFTAQVGDNLPDIIFTDRLKLSNSILKVFQSAIADVDDGKASFTVWGEEGNLMFKIKSHGYGAYIFNQPVNPIEVTGKTAMDIHQYISSSFIDMMGGTLVRMVPNEAVMEFTFNIPVQQTQSSRNVYSGFEGLHILIVDDDERNRMLMREILEVEGAVLSYAANGHQAIELVKSYPHKLDIVLMDIQMPEMDGYTTTRLIHEINSNIPVIGITAHSTPKDREKALTNGMCDFITKPLKIEILMESIGKYVG